MQRLTRDKKNAILSDLQDGEKQSEVARKHGVSQGTVSRIRKINAKAPNATGVDLLALKTILGSRMEEVTSHIESVTSPGASPLLSINTLEKEDKMLRESLSSVERAENVEEREREKKIADWEDVQTLYGDNPFVLSAKTENERYILSVAAAVLTKEQFCSEQLGAYLAAIVEDLE